MKRQIFTAVTIGVLLGLSGCSALSVGGDSYACEGMPEGVRCMGARDVYSATETTDHIAPTDRKSKAENAKQSKTVVASSTDSLNSAGANLTPETPKEIPLRTPAMVMRTWIAPWEDDKGVLHASEYLFSEIEGRRWMVGNKAANAAASTVTPLRNKAGAAALRNVTPLGGK